jgi:hypothetical protein
VWGSTPAAEDSAWAQISPGAEVWQAGNDKNTSTAAPKVQRAVAGCIGSQTEIEPVGSPLVR